MKKPVSEILDFQPRRDHGDITSLKQSIQEIGLINPLTIDEQGRLLAGRRRFQAVAELGWEEVPVYVLTTDGDPLRNLKAEIDENLQRLNYSDPELAVKIAEYDRRMREREGERKAGGDRKSIGHGVTDDPGWSFQRTADALGISKPAVVKAIQIAEAIEERPELAKLKGEQIIRTLKLEAQKEAIDRLEQPPGVYDVIVVDPPWEIAGEYDPDGRRIANPYPTMRYAEIEAINLPAADDCVLWLWVTNYNIHDGFHLLEAWGFKFRGMLTWGKPHFGIGRWLRGQTEHCLLATKGKPLFQGESTGTLLLAPRKEHSAKPDEFYALVEKCCYGRKLDYFSRKIRAGWDFYGDEV